MPYIPPTRPAILEEIKADMRLELGNDPLRRSVEYAMARALTGQSKGQYTALEWIQRQCFPDRVTDDDTFWRWARIFGIDQKAATPWRGTYRFTGVDTTTIPLGTEVVRSDGVTYATDIEDDIGTVVSGYVDVAITAVVDDYGADGNNDDFQPLTLVTPIVDVDNAGIVQDTTFTGADIETVEDGLVRLLLRLRTPPSGGGPGDYIQWALEVDGVTRAWEFKNLYGTNTVGVAFVRDNDGAGSAILPDGTERAAMDAYLLTVVPLTVTATAIELSALDVPITISSLVPDTAAVKSGITVAVDDAFFQFAAPGAILAPSQLSAAISAVLNEESHVLDAPAADVVPTSAQMPIRGTISYV